MNGWFLDLVQRANGNGGAFGLHEMSSLFRLNNRWKVHIYRVSQKKGTFRMLLEPRCTRSITSSWHPSHPDSDELLSANDFFGRFLVRLLSKIKRSQVMSIGHFGPPALNFGYDFWALATFWSHFFWNTLHRLQKKVQGEFSFWEYCCWKRPGGLFHLLTS